MDLLNVSLVLSGFLESETSFVPHSKNKDGVLSKKLILIVAYFLYSEEKHCIKNLCFQEIIHSQCAFKHL